MQIVSDAGALPSADLDPGAWGLVSGQERAARFALARSRWRGGRVVEGAALEMLYRGNSIEGSNPSLSVW